jgi:hypothetical protein
MMEEWASFGITSFNTTSAEHLGIVESLERTRSCSVGEDSSSAWWSTRTAFRPSACNRASALPCFVSEGSNSLQTVASALEREP